MSIPGLASERSPYPASDGNISRAEVESNATLTAEYVAVDIDNDGQLSKSELQGWM